MAVNCGEGQRGGLSLTPLVTANKNENNRETSYYDVTIGNKVIINAKKMFETRLDQRRAKIKITMRP